ncbi:MAG: hypothetical protein ABIH22_01570, partial [Candidatus Margulisiibacteriota bacterium]
MVEGATSAVQTNWSHFLSRVASDAAKKNTALFKMIVQTHVKSGKGSFLYVKVNSKGGLSVAAEGDKDAVKIDLTDGLGEQEAKALGIDLKKGVNQIIAQGWKLNSDKDKQTGVDAVTISYNEIEEGTKAIKDFADAHKLT